MRDQNAVERDKRSQGSRVRQNITKQYIYMRDHKAVERERERERGRGEGDERSQGNIDR